jgi:hypothetical protein
MNAAIQNLEFLRRLIEEARAEDAYADMLRLRMLGSGSGTGQIEQQMEDR